MALSASIVWEIRQGGSDTNGGGFKAGASGTDWTLQNSAQYTLSNGSATTGNATINTVSASSDMVGNVARVSGGTGSIAAGWYEIISAVAGTSITLDRSTGLVTGTGVNITIGGAFGTPGVLSSATGGVGSVLVGGQKAWVKYSATPYNCSSTTAGPGGPCSIPTSIYFTVEGYDAARGDRTGNRPVYRWSVAAGGAYTFVAAGGSKQVFANLAADSNGNSASGFNVAVTRLLAVDCAAVGCSTGFSFSTGSSARGCLATSCTNGFSASGVGVARYCTAVNCTTGFNGIGTAYKCLSYAAGATSGTGFSTNTAASSLDQCTAENHTSGFAISGIQTDLANCLATNCTTGYTVASNSSTLVHCAYYNCTTPVSGTPMANVGAISLSVDPYVSRGDADFRPNATEGGGAALRAAGIDVSGQTAQQDVGAAQHADPSGGVGRRAIKLLG